MTHPLVGHVAQQQKESNIADKLCLARRTMAVIATSLIGVALVLVTLLRFAACFPWSVFS